MNQELQLLAKHYLERFTKHIASLINADHNVFDLIIAAGNSGLASAWITTKVYEALDITPPPVIKVPIMRFIGNDNSKLYNNSSLLTYIKQNLDKYSHDLNNILFVDDEIRYGSTVKNSMNLIMKWHNDAKKTNMITCTVVADEFGGFNWNPPYKNLTIKFSPFIKHTSKYKNIILYNIPPDIFYRLKPFLNKHKLEDRLAINLLLDLPVKEKKADIDPPSFTFKYNQLISEEYRDIEQMKKATVAYITSQIASFIDTSSKQRLPEQ